MAVWCTSFSTYELVLFSLNFLHFFLFCFVQLFAAFSLLSTFIFLHHVAATIGYPCIFFRICVSLFTFRSGSWCFCFTLFLTILPADHSVRVWDSLEHSLAIIRDSGKGVNLSNKTFIYFLVLIITEQTHICLVLKIEYKKFMINGFA